MSRCGCGSAASCSTVDEMQFAALRDTLDISDAACSKHLKVLVNCGYATVEKRESDSSRHMVRWYALTSAGRDAFSGHIAELKRLASGLL